jgi:hypothetical protein
MTGMIQPDRPPYCSANTIGVFWVSVAPHAGHACRAIREYAKIAEILAPRWGRVDL